MTSAHRAAGFDEMLDPGAMPEERLALLAAIIATDGRPTLVFDAAGEVLLGNPAVAAGAIGLWRDLAKQPGWAEHCHAARRSGRVRLALPTGPGGELAVVLPSRFGEAELFLLRLDPQGEQLDRRASELAALAHDLRVPLQALVLSSDAAGAEPGAVAAMAGLALDHISRLLEVYRMDRTPGSAEPEETFEAGALLRDLAALMRPACDSAGIGLELSLPGQPQWLTGQSHLLRAIVQNLVGNAVKAAGVRRIAVALSLPRGAGAFRRRLRLTVGDDGAGLPDDVRALFAAGQTALPEGARQRPGLGLTIVSRALVRLGAEVSVESSPGGTEFCIEFEMPVSEPAESGAGQPAVSLSGLHILCVEDNPINLAILMRALSDAGANVAGITTGQEALDLLAGATGALPDLVFMDVTLPDINGIEVTRNCALHRRDGPVPVIIGLTAHDDPVVHAAGLGAGMARVLVKPVLPSILRRTAAEVAAGRPDRGPLALPQQEMDTMLSAAQVSELVEDLGLAAALSFMRKALAEAQEVAAQIRAAGLTPQGRRDIHSAIGSSGLTGLAGVETALRSLQHAAREGSAAGQECAVLELRIAETRHALDTMITE